MQLKKIFLVFALLLLSTISHSQISTQNSQIENVDYLAPKQYTISEAIITGADNLDHQIILLLTGLSVGEKITVPSEKISMAIDKLWQQGVFEDVVIFVTKIEGDNIFLEIALKERPRLNTFTFRGVSKSDANKLREKLNLITGEVVTENLLTNSKNKIKQYYLDKGYGNASVDVKIQDDTASRARKEVILYFYIDKKDKVTIEKINVIGNEALSDSKVKSTLSETKEKVWWKIWRSSRYIEDDFNKDLVSLIEKYNENGYRDAKIVSDSIYNSKKDKISIDLTVYEGKRFYFRNITWTGNTKYTSEQLTRRLHIEKGTPYNKRLLEERLQYTPNGTDISALYMDDGYLFFQAIPVEVLIDNDSIDIEIRLREGKQARINKITVTGNTRTNDHVIMRELKAYPGKLFSRDAVFIRSVRELGALRYFDQEKLQTGVNVKPDPENGTVDIEYNVEEVSADQFELSGGWGGGMVIGSVGVSFNNFSARNFFKKSAWNPIPSGDGQRLSFRAQTNGTYYYSLSGSFTEPWLGGKKANALTVSLFHSYQSNGFFEDSTTQYLRINGAAVSLGKRLKWPDDWFTLVQGIGFQQYQTKAYTALLFMPTGTSYDLNYNITLGRNSLDAPIYPRYGSDLSIGLQLTPPYSLFNNRDYSAMSIQEKYKWLEYYKVSLKAAWYFNIVDNLVLSTRVRFGFLGYYNDEIGYPPFGRFFLGGDGLAGWALDGREVVALRGYGNSVLSPNGGASVFDKFTMELRYPIMLNPTMTIFGLGFVEAGNSWMKFEQFNPFKPYVSAGLGLRIYMPMFGLLGFDWGYGFDAPPGSNKISGTQFHFSINQSID